MVLGAFGCSSEPTASSTASATDQPATQASTIPRSVSTTAMQRIIVTLKTTSIDPADGEAAKDAVDKAMQRLTSTFPDAKVVRTMPGFSQMVIDLPADQLKALSADPAVASATLEARYSTMPIDEAPQSR